MTAFGFGVVEAHCWTRRGGSIEDGALPVETTGTQNARKGWLYKSVRKRRREKKRREEKRREERRGEKNREEERREKKRKEKNGSEDPPLQKKDNERGRTAGRAGTGAVLALHKDSSGDAGRMAALRGESRGRRVAEWVESWRGRKRKIESGK